MARSSAGTTDSFASHHGEAAAAVRYNSPKPDHRRKTVSRARACSGSKTFLRSHSQAPILMRPFSGHDGVMEIRPRDLVSDTAARLLQFRQKVVQAAIENLFDAVIRQALVNLSRQPLRLVRISAGYRPADRMQGTLQRSEVESHGTRMARIEQQQ